VCILLLLYTKQQAAQEQERVTLTARTKHCMENFHRNNVFKRVAMEIIAYTLEPEEMQVCCVQVVRLLAQLRVDVTVTDAVLQLL
jgi:hypothetical protein